MHNNGFSYFRHPGRTRAMSLPAPPFPLKNHCSVVYNSTVYTYQSDAFQSISLRNGSQWSQLPMGVSATGAQCVQAPVNGRDSLFIIGGSTNASSQSYEGLQVYTFADQTWRDCSPLYSVAQNRLNHGAAYLNSTSSILIYGGFQDNSYSSTSQTFTISTEYPYLVKSFPSDAPVVTQPILLPWNSSHAVLLGGNPNNRDVWVFSEDGGWGQLDVSLPYGLQTRNRVQAALIDGADGSKILEIFDESASPNEVTTLQLQGGDNQSSTNQGLTSSTLTSFLPTETQPPMKRQRRDVVINNWPPYNNSLAPEATRDGFSLAQDPSGLVVITGGNDQNPIAIFNQTGNQWTNTNQFFDATTNPNVTPSPSNTPDPTATFPAATLTTTPSSTSSAVASANNGGNHPLLIVGATLGAVFGTAALLLIILLILRFLRQRRHKAHKRNASDFSTDGKNMDFADQGADFMSSAGGSLGRNHQRGAVSAPNASSTLATGGSRQAKRGFFHKAGDSDGSAKSFFSRSRSPLISSPQPHSDPILLITSPDRIDNPTLVIPSPEPRTEPRTDEGWSKYFVNNTTATDLVNPPNTSKHLSSPSRPTTYNSSNSEYTRNSRIPSSQPHQSAEVAPLNVRSNAYPSSGEHHHHHHHDHLAPTPECPFPFTQPVVAHSKEPQAEPPTPSTFFTHLPEEDEYLDESSGHDSWTPVATSDRGSTWGDRPGSGFYNDNAHPGERVRIPNFPSIPTSTRTSQTTVVHRNDERGLRSTAAKDFAGGLPRRTESRKRSDNGSRAGPSSNRAEARPFPRRTHEPLLSQRREGGLTEEDMSWLNLGR